MIATHLEPSVVSVAALLRETGNDLEAGVGRHLSESTLEGWLGSGTESSTKGR